MKIELVNGSTIQIVGASNVDRIVGSNPAGVVFSEYSLIDPMVWGYILPILKENDGFATFNYFARGVKNSSKTVFVDIIPQCFFALRIFREDIKIISSAF